MNPARFIKSALLLGTCLLAGLTGCSPSGPQVLGRAPEGAPVPFAEARRAAPGQTVTVAGEMVEKCPEAGCWFVLRDASGTLKVDTKTAGFVVVEVPLHRTLTVSGQLLTNGTEVILAATGARY